MDSTAKLLLSTLLFASQVLSQTYKVTGSIPIGGTGGWDYLYADAAGRRLYVSHGTEVVVVDLDSEKVVGTIGGMQGIHGIAIAEALGKGFISDGRSNELVAFDLKSLAVKQKIATGQNPDGIVYDPFSKRVFTFNGRSQDATAVDAETGTVAGTIALGGKPEFPASDGKGSIYANIEDKNEIVRIDPRTLVVQARWPIAPCESPSGLAIDAKSRRLFAVCDGGKMAVVNANSGKVVATPAIGEGPDAAAFDPGSKLVFSSNGQDGTLTVIKEAGPDSYSVVQTVKTQRGARTMALDTKTHRVYLATATFGAAPAATAANPHPRPSIEPGSFKVLVVGQVKTN
jgi:DNA-binding beta-propeller fold protein YncE